jgi:hypothetical protein
MGRKRKFTNEELIKIHDVIKEKKSADRRYGISVYCEENTLVYGTLIKELKRLGLYQDIANRHRGEKTEVSLMTQKTAPKPLVQG